MSVLYPGKLLIGWLSLTHGIPVTLSPLQKLLNPWVLRQSKSPTASYQSHDKLQDPQKLSVPRRTTSPTASYEFHRKLRVPQRATSPTASYEAHEVT